MNEKVYKATVNICASCPARDLFSQHKFETDYKVLQCTNGFSPLVSCEPPIPFDKARFASFDSTGITNYAKRCLQQSLERSNEDWALSNKADYLILDDGLFRVSMNYLGKIDDTALHWTINPGYLSKLQTAGIVPKSVGTKNPEDFTEQEIRQRIEQYLKRFFAHYDQDEIIFMDIRHASVYVDENGNIQPFYKPHWEKENQRIARIYPILKEYLQGCHFIPMPDFVVANKLHSLGLHGMHYTQEYYDYALACMDIICEKLPRSLEEKKIADLCRCCSETYRLKYTLNMSGSLIRTTREKNKLAEEKKKCFLYLDFFKKLMEKNTPLETFFFEKGIRSVIFYGWTMYSKSLVKALEKRGITINAIVEDGNIHYESVLILPRSTRNYPQADAILIADLMNKDIIRKKLNSITTIPVYDDEDLLGI